MLKVLLIVVVLVAVSFLLLGINIFIFRRKFPETEVGKNKHMAALGLSCPSCEERNLYRRKFKPVPVDLTTLKPDWKRM